MNFIVCKGTKPITCHAYNGDQTQLALSLNDENVLIFKKNGNKWEKTAVLSEVKKSIKVINRKRGL